MRSSQRLWGGSKSHGHNKYGMNELTIRQKIYEIRGQRVMLDFDLATAYGVETAQLKRQVRRNIDRFEGEDFMFEASHDELLRCQIGTSSWYTRRKQIIYNSL